jgi:phosphatidylserine/phosphatidylglycerophosphate/cardiolipin synthase-like enzyme
MVPDICKTKIEAIIGSQFPKVVIPKIDNAKKSIKIVVFDWRWYPNDPANPCQLFNQSIVRAIGRGVRVSVVANNFDIIETLKEVGASAKKLVTKNLVHAKLMIIDDLLVIIGSHNYTQSAFTMNYEISAMYEDAESAKMFSGFFQNLYGL